MNVLGPPDEPLKKRLDLRRLLRALILGGLAFPVLMAWLYLAFMACVFVPSLLHGG